MLKRKKHKAIDRSFEEKAQIVASAYFSRFDEDGEAEILQKLFDLHDMSGATALALVGGDIDIISDEPKQWIEETFNVLNSIFDFPESLGEVESEQAEPESEESFNETQEENDAVHNFDEKVMLVANAYRDRLDENGESEILQKIFGSQDLSGPIAVGIVGGNVRIKSAEARLWIEETYNTLDEVFDLKGWEQEWSEIESQSEANSAESDTNNQGEISSPTSERPIAKLYPYLSTQQQNFTTDLNENDIPRKLLISNVPNSFPVLEVMAMGYLFEGPPEKNKRLKKIKQKWISEKKSNYLTALGYLLLMRDDSDFAINLLEESADLGDVWALIHLEGNAKSLTESRRESYLLRAFEQGHGMAAFRLACLAIERNDFESANNWLIKGCLLGGVASTEALSKMVSSENEKLMLSKIASEQRGWQGDEN